jgi:NAD(P)-dependent dehydrogenase (short-subunit alcohol dehydrogenase family)
VRAGADGVVIAGRRQEKLDEVIAGTHEYNKGSTRVISVRTDVKIEEDVDHLFQHVKETFGRPADVVYANAGWVSDLIPSANESVKTWWSVYVSDQVIVTSVEP